MDLLACATLWGFFGNWNTDFNGTEEIQANLFY